MTEVAGCRSHRRIPAAVPSVHDARRLPTEDGGSSRHGLTHHLFRYPAKFHPPVIRALIEEFSEPRSRVFDPFCGSGTALVEAGSLRRRAYGLDVDPLAVAVATAKTARYSPLAASRAATRLESRLAEFDRGRRMYERYKFTDLGQRTYRREMAELRDWIPPVPNLDHWFRRYVIIDLARIRREIHSMRIDLPTKRLLFVIFASIVRNASNADPVPVSGLEVTAHMRLRELEGRLVDPFHLFDRPCDAVSARLRRGQPAWGPTRSRRSFRAMQPDSHNYGNCHGALMPLSLRPRITTQSTITVAISLRCTGWASLGRTMSASIFCRSTSGVHALESRIPSWP